MQAFGFQINNGIPIESWYDDPEDKAFLNLLPVLEHLSKFPDVRPVIGRLYKTQQLVDNARA